MNKTLNTSLSQSFYLQIRPTHFQLEYSFAKGLKSGTKYRLQLYKGIQKIDEMDSIRARIIGGKVDLNSTSLNFNVALFNPTKNISFTIVVLQTKPYQKEAQIAKHIIKSNDFIDKFINSGQSIHKEEVQLIDGFKFAFRLFVHTSKGGLDQMVESLKVQEEGRDKMVKSAITPKKGGYATDTFSQSDADQSVKDGTPPNLKKISRRRGHEGKLKVRNINSDAFSQREFSLSSKNNKECDYSFTKRSPPEQMCEERKPQNLVSLTRRDSNASEVLIQFEPNLFEKGVSCMEKLQSTYSQVIESKKQEQEVSRARDSNIDLFCGMEDINQSTLSCSHNKSSHRISIKTIKTRQSLQDIPELKLKHSYMQRHFSSTSEVPEQSAKRQFESVRQTLFYVLFSMVSLVLLYWTISPSRRV